MRPIPSAPAALLFDAMGTLVHLAAPAAALREELAVRCDLSVSEAQAGLALRAEIAYYRAHMQEGATPAALHELRARCTRALRAALPPSPRLAALAESELTAALLGALRFAAYPDAAPALAWARRRGRRLVVVSNWDCSLPDVLDAVGLTPFLDGVLTSAEVGAAKPAPLIFARALELAGCEAHEALHIGDSEREDVAGARAAGVAVLLLARDGAPAPAGTPTIRSLGELEATLPNLGD